MVRCARVGDRDEILAMINAVWRKADGSPGDIRLIASGPTFNDVFDPPLYDLALQKDGKYIISGGGWYSGYLVRYNPDGSLDEAGKVQTSFGPFWDRAFALDVGPDGKIVVVGEGKSPTDPSTGPSPVSSPSQLAQSNRPLVVHSKMVRFSAGHYRPAIFFRSHCVGAGRAFVDQLSKWSFRHLR